MKGSTKSQRLHKAGDLSIRMAIIISGELLDENDLSAFGHLQEFHRRNRTLVRQFHDADHQFPAFPGAQLLG